MSTVNEALAVGVGGAEPAAGSGESRKARVDWVDGVKGAAIVMVVVYHVFNGLLARREVVAVPGWWEGWVWPLMQPVMMPVFFFVSGLFLIRAATKPAAVFFAEKAGTILWPMIIWATAQTLVGQLAGGRAQSGVSLKDLPLALLVSPPDQFWFLYVLFLSMAAYWTLAKLRVPPWGMVTIGLALVGIKGFVDVSIIGLDRWKMAFPFMGYFIFLPLGAAVSPWLFERLEKTSTPTLATLAAISLALTAIGVRLALHTTHGGGWPVWNQPGAMSFFVTALAAISIAGLISAIVLLRRAGFGNGLRRLGELSLHLYVLHVIFIAATRTLLLKAQLHSTTLHVLAETTAGLGGPVVVALLAKQFRADWLFQLRPAKRGKAITV